MNAIIIVDVQRAFPVPGELVERIEERSRHFPLRVFTRFVNPAESIFRRKLGRDLCAPGSPDIELILPTQPGDVVFEKPGYGLTAEHVATLKQKGIREALICGVDTDACVLGVSFSLFDAGIECHVDPELCWSSIGLHDVALKIIRAQFATG